ncbi:MAG TPA: hypothetical protein VNF72_00265 [Myxococcota bacterium]|nr:hypothetical protein [Myxococcota bacterium]
MKAFPSCRTAFLLLVVASALARSAAAQARDETERWVPSLGIASGVIAQKANASTDSTGLTYNFTSRRVVNGQQVVTTTPTTNEHLRPPTSGDDVLVTPFVGGTLELMTPGLQSIPGKPRMFAHGDVASAFGSERKVSREKAPSTLEDPLPTFPSSAEEAVKGIGSETAAEVQPLLITAGGGIAWTLDAFGRRIRIKSSVEYQREEIDLTGKVIRAVNTDTGIQAQPPGIPVGTDAAFFGVTLQGNETEVFQGVGAGLEVEVDTGRAGPFMVALFVNGRGLKILGDRKIEFSNTTTVSDPALIPNVPTDVTADWEFEKKPWQFAGGVDIRFRWLPE